MATWQNTVNDELDKVQGTGWRTYIAGVAYFATSNGDAYPIGILLISFKLAENHGDKNLFSSVLGNIFKLDDAEVVCAFHLLVIEDVWSFADSLA